MYEEKNFAPIAKLEKGEMYSIIHDYIGRPIQMYNIVGEIVWETEYDIYGRLKNLKGDRLFQPYRFAGQYYDNEIDLCYQRYRYYDPNTGNFISQDPIGLAGGNPTMYAYVKDSNSQIDPFGLDVYGTLYYCGRLVSCTYERTTTTNFICIHEKGRVI